ncbi:MAG: hypothetical protein SGPRY_007054, partial [Prymnesium sp.]
LENVHFTHAATADAFPPSLLPQVSAVVFAPGASSDELRKLLHATPQCRWLHSLSAGVDKLAPLLPELRASRVALTNGRGAFSQSLAEYTIAAALHFNKQLTRCAKNREGKLWDAFTMNVLAGKTMGFVGYGDIAKSAAKLAAAFGMRLLALRRQPADPAGAANDLIAQTYCSDNDPTEFYRQCDFVMCSLPLTEATRGFIGEQAFASMKPGCVFISLGRGAVVDEGALLRALQRGEIGGAACDVFEVEPLPESSPLWSCENLLLTAHNADLTEDFFARAWKVWADNHSCYMSGTAFATLVDLEAGY